MRCSGRENCARTGLGVKILDNDGAKHDVGGLQRHVRDEDSRVDVAAVFAVIAALPADAAVVTDDEYDRRIKMAPRALLDFFKRLRVVNDDDFLGLIVAGGRRKLGGFQDKVKLFLFHGLFCKAAQRKAFPRQVDKGHA